MKRMTVILAALAATSALSTTALADNLELKRVMLSSGGVGYFEYEADVNGWETIELPVRLDQMDDVLKSIVIFDDKGGSGVVEMPSRSPLSEIFRSLPIGEEAFASTAALMNALKGAEVEVEGAVSATGRIVGAWPETQQTETGTVTRTRMAVVGDAGVQQFVLEETSSIRFLDPVLEGQVKSALAAMAQYRARDGLTLRITARGDGARRLYVGYVVEAPLWKTSYRLVSAPQGDKARMQGWAILENTSGVDWNNVELTLVTGNPVTLRQALYTAYYVDRPQVPVEVLGRVLPNVDDGAVSVDSLRVQLEGEANSADVLERAAGGEYAPSPMAPPPPVPMLESTTSTLSIEALREATTSQEAATQVTFVLNNSVTVRAGESLAAPIIDREVSGQRVAFFDPNTHGTHPLAAVRLTNDSGTSLPPGIVTLFETDSGRTTYVGDAQLATFPMGETRMISFALDQKVTIDREETREETITSARIVAGVMEISIAGRSTTMYRVKGANTEARRLILSHPRMDGWEMRQPDPASAEVSGQWLRLPYDLAAGQETQFDVVFEQARTQEFYLASTDLGTVEYWLGRSEFSDAQKEALQRIRDIRMQMAGFDSAIQTANAERDRIYQEQARIRENLGAVPEGGDLARRYLEQMSAHEDRLAQLGADLTRLEGEKAAAEQALRDYVAALNL